MIFEMKKQLYKKQNQINKNKNYRYIIIGKKKQFYKNFQNVVKYNMKEILILMNGIIKKHL